MQNLKLLKAVLTLFDGDGGGDAGATGETASDAGKHAGEYDNVIFGKQPDAQPETHEETVADDAGQQAAPEKRPFKDLINGEYKEDFDNIFQKRFKDYKALEKANKEQNAVIEMLNAKYGTSDIESLTKAIEDDDAMWESAAYENGMTTEQYKAYRKLEQENSRLREAEELLNQEREAQQTIAQWQQEAMQLKAKYPDFDLEQELLNEEFAKMISPTRNGGRGFSMDTAYKIAHFDDLQATAVVQAAAQTEKNVIDNIRAKGARPIENGTASQSAFTIKADPSKWTKRDRAEVRRRVAMGEEIYL